MKRRYVDKAGLGAIAAQSRANAGKTQQEAADELGFKQSQISAAESGGNVKAAIAVIERYSSRRVRQPFYGVDDVDR